jgi:hypothetical protein
MSVDDVADDASDVGAVRVSSSPPPFALPPPPLPPPHAVADVPFIVDQFICSPTVETCAICSDSR